ALFGVAMIGRRMEFLVLGLILSLMAVPAGTVSLTHLSEYDISLGILPIAKASFASEFGSRDYRITGSFRSWGIADIITRISAKTQAHGQRRGDELQTERFSLVYKSGKRTRVYEVSYR